MEKLLQERSRQKKKKPDFIRQDAHKKKRVGSGWRRSKGTDSKMRISKRGYRKSIAVGYKSPAKVRGLSREGLEMVHVSRPEDLKDIDPKTQGIIISSKTGMRKKIQIMEDSLKLGLKVLNIKDAEKYLNEMKRSVEKRIKDKKKSIAEKELKAKKKEEAAKKKQAAKKSEKDKASSRSLEDDINDEEKKLQEKKEKDKLLIKKG